MPNEPWRAPLDRALERDGPRPGHRFVQLATLGIDGGPAVRTVVFRGFLGETSGLLFTTDARSEKCREIEVSPRAALCWWFDQSREQFRFSGLVRLVGSFSTDPVLRRTRRDVWRGLSDQTRAGFGWPDPGAPRDRGSDFSNTPPDVDAPLDAFALLLFEAAKVDRLELDGDPQRRWRYTLHGDDRWSTSEVNP